MLRWLYSGAQRGSVAAYINGVAAAAEQQKGV